MTVTSPCMDIPPVMPLDPKEIQGELTKKQVFLLAKSFITLAMYVQAQHAKCGVRASAE